MDPVVITALDQEGRGIARVDGKAVFVEGALIGERVSIEVFRRKPRYEQARVVEIHTESAARTIPRCPYFGVCGGCSLQHVEAGAQVAAKQRVLEDALWHIGRVRPQQMLAPIHGPTWEYRQRARLSVRDVPKKGGVLVGFREKKSSYVTDMTSCDGAPGPHFRAAAGVARAGGAAVDPRSRAADRAGVRRERPQGPSMRWCCAFLRQPSNDDERELVAFADRHGVHIWLQPGGPATVRPFHPAACHLAYALPDFGVAFAFDPTDFTQVNADVNRVLVRRAIGLLDPAHGERIADFFCGLGNFTLPIARRGASVIGIEGSASLIRRAEANAAANGLATNATFAIANLFEATRGERRPRWAALDKALIDPPREGAIALVKALPAERPRADRLRFVQSGDAGA